MNNKDSHIQFKVLLDKNSESVAFGGCPAFLPEEIDIFLNNAQYQILSNKFTGNNSLKTGFEQDATRISELDYLVRSDNNQIAINTDNNEFVIDNIHDNGNRLIIIGFSIQLNNNKANCDLVDHNSAELYKQTYNNLPWIEDPIVYLEDNKAYVLVDPILMQTPGFEPTNVDGRDQYYVNVTYIKKPKDFNYKNPEEELDLPEDVIKQVIDRAVELALENIESQRFQSKVSIDQLSE